MLLISFYIKFLLASSSLLFKECGSINYPDIVDASLSVEALSVGASNNVIYGIGNYTFFL